MDVYIRCAEHVKKRRHKNFHSGSSVDVFSTSAKTSKRRPLDVTLPSGSDHALTLNVSSNVRPIYFSCL